RMPARLGRWARRRPALGVAALIVAASAAFLMFPAIDLGTSARFYDGAGFPDLALAERTRDAARFVEAVVAAGFFAPLVVRLILPERRFLLRPRDSLFGLLALALGPGLLVNGILKEVWGRARPREILEFGGDATFTPV